MRNLTDEQIDFIAEDIRRRGVSLKSLEDDLLDHICCFIEQTDDQRPFEQVYLGALDSFGHNGLQLIQDETLFLINQPYFNKMKKIAYITGTFASMALVLGSLFKLMHWPGANILLISGTLILTFLFVPYFFYTQFKEQTEKKGKVVSIIGLIAAFLLCNGAFFKIMHWPGASLMIVAFGFFFIIFLPLYMMNGLRNPATRLASISNGFLFACVGGFMMLLSFHSSSKNVMDSMTTIENNNTAMVQQLTDQLKSSDTAGTSTIAIEKFKSACDKAVETYTSAKGSGAIPKNDPVTGEDLQAFNNEVSAAVDQLNSALSSDVKWNKLEFTPFSPTLSSNLRFQIEQMKCKAIINAM
jgi:hypothetical protein